MRQGSQGFQELSHLDQMHLTSAAGISTSLLFWLGDLGMASLSLSFSTVKWDDRIYFTEAWQELDEVIPIECPANLMCRHV